MRLANFPLIAAIFLRSPIPIVTDANVTTSVSHLFDEAEASPDYLKATELNVTVEKGPYGAVTNGLILLRIQKTGTSTFGDKIMKKMCGLHGIPCDVYWHADWDIISHAAYFKERSIVTWIRDPVERIFSEFEYVRNVGAFEQVQWDYTPEQQAKLQAVTTIEEFVKVPGNPANNRATRYLLGFARPNLNCYSDCGEMWQPFFTRGGIAPGKQIEHAIATGTPAATILAVAKGRLSRNIQLLGITDCFDASLQVLAVQLGWHAPTMLADASVHYRAGGSNATATTTPSHRAGMTPATVAAIEKYNSFDKQIYLHALALLNVRMAQLTPYQRCAPSLAGQ